MPWDVLKQKRVDHTYTPEVRSSSGPASLHPGQSIKKRERYSSCRYNERQLIEVTVVRRVRPRAERWCDCEGHRRWKRAGSTLFCNWFGNWLPATALKTPISLSSVFRLFFILFFLSNFINRPSVLFWGGDVALVHKYRHIRILGPGTSFVFGAISSIGLLFFVFLGMQPWYISTNIYVSWHQVHQSWVVLYLCGT